MACLTHKCSGTGIPYSRQGQLNRRLEWLEPNNVQYSMCGNDQVDNELLSTVDYFEGYHFMSEGFKMAR